VGKIQMPLLGNLRLALTAPERNDLLELLDDRIGSKATLITSQLPVSAWHQWLEDPTLADAILDRIVHAAHKITLKGESMRRKQTKSVTSTTISA
jgi:DNA replication protein DnaC